MTNRILFVQHKLARVIRFRVGFIALVMFALLVCGAWLELPARAQQTVTSATLGGRVEDAGGALISGANITAINLETNQRQTTVSDEAGRYRFSYLTVGTYQLTAESAGFTTLTQKLTLTLGEARDVPLRLNVAAVTESVQVTDALAPVVETSRTQVAETILPQEIDDLPLNGRNYLDLAALTPAVTRSNPVANQRFPETSAVPSTGLSITGQRFINNGFIVDGLSANDDAADLAGTFYSEEVIREFQVITSGGIAEFSRASGGFVNIITRSGTNNLNGRVYGFLRNQRFDARNPLLPTKDPLTQAQYGASLGGALKHDRTFFFSNFEQTRLHYTQAITVRPADVAAINARLDAINYKGQRIQTGAFPTGYNTTNFFARVDHRLNDANLLTARYSLYDITSENARNVGGLSAVSRGTALLDRDQTIAINNVTTVSSRTLNEARFQFTRSRLRAPVNDVIGPAINISGVASFGTATFSPTARNIASTEFVDTIISTRGAHSVKGGADFLLNRVNIVFPGALQGVYTFSTLANFQSGTYVNFQQAFGAISQFQSNPNIGLFIQDEWKPRAD